MRKLKYASILAVLASFFLCTSCSQDEEVQLIQDGAEAATIAGVIALSADPATAPFASIIDEGLGVCQKTGTILYGTHCGVYTTLGRKVIGRRE